LGRGGFANFANVYASPMRGSLIAHELGFCVGLCLARSAGAEALTECQYCGECGGADECRGHHAARGFGPDERSDDEADDETDDRGKDVLGATE